MGVHLPYHHVHPFFILCFFFFLSFFFFLIFHLIIVNRLGIHLPSRHLHPFKKEKNKNNIPTQHCQPLGDSPAISTLPTARGLTIHIIMCILFLFYVFFFF